MKAHDWHGRVSHMTAAQQKIFVRRCYRQQLISDWHLWDLLSSDQTSIHGSTAARIYESLGFEPFAGYPLQPLRAGNY